MSLRGYRKPTRSQRAERSARRTGLHQYGLLPCEVEDAEKQIKKSQSRFVCHIGDLTVHRMMLSDQEVYCAYDSNISRIGFFIDYRLAVQMHYLADERKSPLPLPSQSQ